MTAIALQKASLSKTSNVFETVLSIGLTCFVLYSLSKDGLWFAFVAMLIKFILFSVALRGHHRLIAWVESNSLRVPFSLYFVSLFCIYVASLTSDLGVLLSLPQR